LKHIFPACLPLLLAAFAAGSAAAPVQAATLNVPAQYGTIQSAITAAQPGDIVLLADGTYTGVGNVNLDFGGKSITVTSQNGAAKTIIDCQRNAARGVYFHSGEGAAAKLQGVTIQNGFSNGLSSSRGGGIGIYGSSPTIMNCVLTNNNSGGGGGGLYADTTSHPQIANCVFAGNTGFNGAGLLAEDGVAVTGCTFTGNDADYAGGGAYFRIANGVGGTISGCTFTGNTSGTDGAGGAGVYSQFVGGTVINTFISCVFVGNIAYTPDGGGFAGEGVLTNCTFTGNIVSPTGNMNPSGAAVSTSGGSITNCILFGDSGTELSRNNTFSSIASIVSFCDIQGGFEGKGNISVDPRFDRSFNLAATPADYGDEHLRTDSALVRAGTTSGAPLTTLDGAVRPVPPSIGAYEVGPTLLPTIADSYVLSSAPTQNFGSAPTLTVGGFLGAAYLQFDLSRLGTLTAGSSIKLHINAGRPQAGTASLVVFATGSAWTEAGLAFQNRPALGTPQGFLNVAANGRSSAPYDLDITSYVKAQQALGVIRISLALSQFASGQSIGIDSKENPANDGPHLVITY
jgi:hypothetical protein